MKSFNHRGKNSSSSSNNNESNNKPKLYSFYDIINKKKNTIIDTDKSNLTKSNINLNQSYQDIRVLNTPQFKSNYSPNNQDSNNISEPHYITMPVKSSFLI
jgi:hypothetical protein